ncbi:class I SAM-dependent methyltransferase [Methanimicrococcus sp. OttesenSCG-928-J09]|nr:class I SAM-dependent methyltransferase [Methanimicrococcus sp. OttesenSCG-928-J09]
MSQKKIFEKKMSTDKEGRRFATPEPVAKYRAARLTCNTIADISCGIGGQTIYFAQRCKHVYAVEIDAQKLEYAKENCAKFGLDNVTFICGDALDPAVIAQIPKVDIVFSDPARPPEEEMRQVDSLRPGIPMVMEAYADKTENFAFEAPPQMPPERVDFDCEKEYISLNGQLNRLTLYFGKIKRYNKIAVSLPDGNAMVDAPVELPPMVESDKPMLFMFEPDPAVIAAGLLNELVDDMIKATVGHVRVMKIDKKRTLLTADLLTVNPMNKNNFIVLRTMPFDSENDYAEINEFFKKSNVGKVTLRGSIDPQDYWGIRNQLEADLDGAKKVHLFLKEQESGQKEAILCELIYE